MGADRGASLGLEVFIPAEDLAAALADEIDVAVRAGILPAMMALF